MHTSSLVVNIFAIVSHPNPELLHISVDNLLYCFLNYLAQLMIISFRKPSFQIKCYSVYILLAKWPISIIQSTILIASIKRCATIFIVLFALSCVIPLLWIPHLIYHYIICKKFISYFARIFIIALVNIDNKKRISLMFPICF